MSDSHQPGSPGAVDLDALEDLRMLALCAFGAEVDEANGQFIKALAASYPSIVTELRTLRARVGELESWNQNQAGQITTLERTLTREEGRAIDAQERAESAEARVKELEGALDTRAQTGRRDCPDCIDGSACAPGGCGAVDCESCGQPCPTCGGTTWVQTDGKRDDARITDLESQLAAAREEQGLDAKVREVLGERFRSLDVRGVICFGIVGWSAVWPQKTSGESARAGWNTPLETLPALLRAILEVEARS